MQLLHAADLRIWRLVVEMRDPVIIFSHGAAERCFVGIDEVTCYFVHKTEVLESGDAH